MSLGRRGLHFQLANFYRSVKFLIAQLNQSIEAFESNSIESTESVELVEN